MKKIILYSSRLVGTLFGTLFISSLGLFYYIDIKSNHIQKNKLNIIFDLDETIIHTDKLVNYNNLNKSNITTPSYYEIYSNRKIWIRPYVQTIIPILAKFNNLYLFTKATEPYTNDILIKTNFDKYFIEKKYRTDCENTCKNINKFLELVHNEKNTILVDDKITNKCDGQNFYHIPKFNYFVKNDIEILKLFCYILWLNIKTDFELKLNKN